MPGPILPWKPVYRRGSRLYACPGAEISSVAAKTAASILFRKEMAEAKDDKETEALFRAAYYVKYVNVYRAASLRYINDIIEPRETRPVLIRALNLL